MFKTEFINFQDRLFIVKKIIREEYNPNIEAWKQYLSADTVLRRDGILYFLESVPDLEIIPEVNTNEVI
jgi:hypothetical protein